MKLITRSVLALLGSASALSAATFFTEDFSGGNAGSNLTLGTGAGTPSVSYAAFNFKNSADNSRIYLGTNNTDYSTVDFVFQATVTMSAATNGYGIAFFGMGNSNADGPYNSGNFGEPITGSDLFMALRPDNNTLESRDNATSATGTVQQSGLTGVQSNTHLFRMTWTAATKSALFEYDAGNNGSIDKSFTLNGADNGFTGLNSQLVFGGGNGVTFDNISVVPEPSTYGLIGAGVLAGITAIRRRRKHAGTAA